MSSELTPEESKTLEERQLDPRCEQLPFTAVGPFINLDDGRVMGFTADGALLSNDDGETWPDILPACADFGKNPANHNAVVKTQSGVIVQVYMDMAHMKKGTWDDEKHNWVGDYRLDVWSVRSFDEAKTWVGAQQLLDGFCGALIGMIQTRRGRLVVPVQDAQPKPFHHAQYVYVSDDDGKTWTRSHLIDIGGRGHHDGAVEPTIVELTDGRIWMLIRTNLDRFWQTWSEDEGRTWQAPMPTHIDASSAPGHMIRLAGGKLALAWNRLYPTGLTAEERENYPRREEAFAYAGASCHREELSLAFSEDDGETWTDPVVVARQKDGSLSYPLLFERRPGEVWLITRFGTSPKLSLRLKEADFAG